MSVAGACVLGLLACACLCHCQSAVVAVAVAVGLQSVKGYIIADVYARGTAGPATTGDVVIMICMRT